MTLRDSDGQMEVKHKFVFPRHLEQKDDQHLFISKDFTKLLEVHGEEAIIYKLQDESGERPSSVKFVGEVAHLPTGLCNGDVY